jgi:outer membrane lipopolysaccharide assembly protein LptE/RlpB
MNMKKLIIISILSFSILLTSCGILNRNQGVTGNATKKQQGAEAKIEMVDDKTANVNVKRLDKIGEISYGTGVALAISNGVPAAVELNKRVEALANQPSIEAMKQMEIIVNQLLTNNATLLDKKDKEITALGIEMKKLAADKEAAVNNQIKVAEANAAKADKYKATLDEMDAWLGLGAVWYGLVKFFTSSMWILGIGGILFLVLRLAAASNPVCGAIFSIFEQIVAWGINAVKIVFPKALSFAGHVTKEVYDASRGLLSKIIDSLQIVKVIEKKTGKDCTIKELLDELSTSLDKTEKDEIKKIKADLGY